jgi:hypothetical protein
LKFKFTGKLTRVDRHLWHRVILLLAYPMRSFLFFSLALAAAGTSLPIWYSQCEGLGYSPGKVACGACKVIAKALGTAHESVAACQSCCSASLDIVSGTGTRKRFDTVALRVCRLQPGGSGVQEWLEKREQAWSEKGVVVEDFCAFGEPPLVVLRNDRDELEEAAAAEKPQVKAVPGKKKPAAAAKKTAAAPAEGALVVGVSVPVTSWKVEHIDAFIEASLKPE